MAAKQNKLMIVDCQTTVNRARMALHLGHSWRVEPWRAALMGAEFDHIVVLSFEAIRIDARRSLDLIEAPLKDFIAQLRCRLLPDGLFVVLP